jgi:hypothetical protein
MEVFRGWGKPSSAAYISPWRSTKVLGVTRG